MTSKIVVGVAVPANRSVPCASAERDGRRHTERGGTAPYVSVIVPAKNEAANIGWVLARMPQLVDEVIVVDGHSTDGTVDVVRRVRPDARILTEEGRGKGAALRTGFAAAR